MADKLKFTHIDGGFADRYNRVHVYEVSGGPGGFSAFVYQCRLNLDLDGAPRTYGLNNWAAAKNSLGKENLQKYLSPLESWHLGYVSADVSQRVGLGNACGDPGDGTKGWRNYSAGNRKFYWAGIKALREKDAAGFVIDKRPELEAGLDQNYEEYFKKNKKLPDLLPKGSGYFPVVQQERSLAKGYYISTTSVVSDGDASPYDANRYLDATKVPYAVWANRWKWVKSSAGIGILKQGDYGIAIRVSTGANTGFLYGDSGTPNRVGECSPKVHYALGGEGSPVYFIAFPGSGIGPVVGKNPEANIRARVMARSTRLGPVGDLAMFLAAGIINAKKDLILPSQQARAFNNAFSALGKWT